MKMALVFLGVSLAAWWTLTSLLMLAGPLGPIELPVAMVLPVIVGTLAAVRYSRRHEPLARGERIARRVILSAVAALLVVQVVGGLAIGGHAEVGGTAEVIR